MNKAGGAGSSETHRKLFIGGLNYSTTDETLKDYFSKFGELVDCVVMKFRDTKRSRGFGFVTYAAVEQVDECQNNRPHTIDGTKVETKRATPRDDTGPGAGQTVQKIFLGGLKDGVSDDNLRDYFGEFGAVVHVEQMTDKSTGRKRGFGFVEFDDYDAVDKLMLKGNHHVVNGYKIDVKKAISKTDMNSMGGGGGGPRGGGGMHRGGDRGGPRQAPAPWGPEPGYGGGYGNQGGGFGNQGGGYGGPRGGGGGGYGGPGGSWGGAGNQGGPGSNVDPWNQGGNSNSWGNQGGNGGGNGGWNDNSGWGNDTGYGGGYGDGPPGGYGSQGGYQSGPRGGGGPQGGPGGQVGGPMRGNTGGYRSAPYSVGARGGAGGGGGYSQRGGGGGSRW